MALDHHSIIFSGVFQMNRKEAIRQTEQENILMSLGFTSEQSEKLRRISMTLTRWYELECGIHKNGRDISIERDDATEKPFLRVQFMGSNGKFIDRKSTTNDREKGALKRLGAIIQDRNNRFNDVLSAYVQSDPRGHSLYIIRPGDVPEGKKADSFYSNGVCVF
jgi:hypothetical protein